eukprot:3445076-Rhodomonas_salina.1
MRLAGCRHVPSGRWKQEEKKKKKGGPPNPTLTPRNPWGTSQAIPTKKNKVFTTEVDNQPNVFLQVYQVSPIGLRARYAMPGTDLA